MCLSKGPLMTTQCQNSEPEPYRKILVMPREG